jgi:hypothetical protein
MPISPYVFLGAYAAAAIAIILTLVLFWSVKREIARTACRERHHLDDMLHRLQQASTTRAPAPPEAVYVPAAIPPGFNLQRRSQAVRLLRKGEDTAHIAAVLGATRREIELLVKVQELGSRAAHAGE